jgi:hypothetical protein
MSFTFGHCVVCPSSFGHCVVCPSSFGHCVVCPLLLAIVLYVLLLLVIVLYVLLRFTASDYLFGIFKIFLAENKALFVAKQNNEKQRQNKSRNVWEWIKNIVILVCLVWLIVHVA